MRACRLTFRSAVLLSLLVHGLLFGSVLAFARHGGTLPGGEPRSVAVTLVEGGGAAGPKGRPLRKVLRDHAGPSPTVRRVEMQKPVPDRTLQTAKGEVESAVTDTASGPAAEADGAASSTKAVSAEGAKIPTEAANAAKSGGADDVDSRGADGPSPNELQRLQALIERVKTYPRLARERGIEGTALVRFRVTQSGEADSVTVVKSSGARILDEASIETIFHAAREEPLPKVKGWLEVPITYMLK